MSKPTIIVIYGPPGSGKTSNANYLKGKYACKHIVDDWNGVGVLRSGDLVLTQRPEGLALDARCRCIHIAEALR